MSHYQKLPIILMLTFIFFNQRSIHVETSITLKLRYIIKVYVSSVNTGKN